MFKGAYLGKLLRINLTTREYRSEDVNPDELKMLLGGRGLAAGYYFHEIGAELNPFDPENRVFLPVRSRVFPYPLRQSSS